MPLPVTSFAGLAAGNQNLSLFDSQFNAVAAQGVIACSASGTNAIALTPLTNYFVPSSYTDAAPQFAWKATQTSTGAVTINVASLGAVNAYKNNGSAQIGSGDIVSGNYYSGAYLGALNSGAGGIVVDVVPTSLTVMGAVQASFKNLQISVSSNTQIVVTADQVNLFDGVSNFSSPTSINSTIATGTSGVNGLDTGAIANGTFYSVWVIQNTASGATAGLISLSATAPTMPTGYAKKARVGWVTTATGVTTLMKTLQIGRRVQYVVTGTTPNTALPTIASGTTGTINSTTFTGTSSSVTSVAPSTAGSIIVVLSNQAAASAIGVAPNNNYAGWATANPAPIMANRTDTATTSLYGELVLESTAVFYAAVSANGLLQCLGWVDNI